MYDEVAEASYSYDASRRVFNSYDNPRAVKAKCEYIKRRGLGGLIMWESMLSSGEGWLMSRFWRCAVGFKSVFVEGCS
jgi:GH18 family chitinase